MVKKDDFASGNVFLIPCGDGYILSQIGHGEDLGVFDKFYKEKGDFRPGHIGEKLAFRVHFGKISPRKFGWISMGRYPLFGSMAKSALYYHQAVGDDQCFIVQHGTDDQLVSCSMVKNLEPLATWSHAHIVKRFKDSLISD